MVSIENRFWTVIHLLSTVCSEMASVIPSCVWNVCREMGFAGSQSTVKRYIAAHKHLIPAKRQLVAPQGNRGRRYMTDPGEAFQMDWGFTKVLNPDGTAFQAACFAMICHHCGQRYVEFFPNARQEKDMIRIPAFAFLYLLGYAEKNGYKGID